MVEGEGVPGSLTPRWLKAGSPLLAVWGQLVGCAGGSLSFMFSVFFGSAELRGRFVVLSSALLN